MNGFEYTKKSKNSVNNILVWAVGILFILTMLSTWLICGLLAKYMVTNTATDAARVAAGGTIELLEHKADLKNGIYVLDESKEVTDNTYERVIPGVDIAKDPFIRLDLEYAEVDYELYIQVTESKYLPNTVTYSLTDDWEVFNEAKGIYKYKGYFDAATKYEDNIKILKDDKLYVSEHYVGNNQEFSLKFSAWIKQAD